MAPAVLTFRVSGMTCQKCVRLITECLESQAEVRRVLRVDKAEGMAEVEVTEEIGRRRREEIARDIEALAGGSKFKVKVQKTGENDTRVILVDCV